MQARTPHFECSLIGVLMRFSNQPARSEPILTYEIYLHAYELRDRMRPSGVGRIVSHPAENRDAKFQACQKLVRYTAYLCNRLIETMPFLILHFINKFYIFIIAYFHLKETPFQRILYDYHEFKIYTYCIIV